MSVITIREGLVFSSHEWATNIGVTSTEIKFLVDTKILRRTDEGDYILKFVGVVIFKDTLLFAPPKFNDARPLDLPDVLRILRSYFSRSSLRTPFADRQRDPEFDNTEVLREFDALLGLKDWFFAHGLYRREQAKISNRGRPHWGKTIAKCSALITREGVIYPSIIAEQREGVLNDISALQVGVLRQLLLRYGLAVPAAIQHAELATGMGVNAWPLEHDARLFYERRLAHEQRSTYRTETLHLLKLLRAVLDTRLAGSIAKPQIYGTTAFYAVWEDACQTSISGDRSPDSSSTLGQPTWWVPDNEGNKKRHKHMQKPDFHVKIKNWLLILDAKYYYPFPNARPGGPDIIKQVYYAESLLEPQANVLSIFILPFPNAATPRFLGYASIEGSHRNFGTIEAWGIDPILILSQYPSTLASRANSIINVILHQRGSVAEFIGQTPSDIRL